MAERTFESLIEEALGAPFEGWRFAWLRGRSRIEPLPWSYPREVERLAAGTASMLDMGTGGGEVLSRFKTRPPMTVATEAWPPNVPVAATRLRPLGIRVVRDEGSPENFDHDGVRGRIPFRYNTFSLVTNRHDAFFAREVARILRPGGTFITQQVETRTYDDFYEALDLPKPEAAESWLPLATEQVEDAGLVTVRAETGEERQYFDDIGAVVYYLRAVTWAVLGFDIDSCMPALRRLHDRMRDEPLLVRQRRFLLIASKPS